MVIDSLFQKMSQNLPIYLPMYPHLPSQNETANSLPDSKLFQFQLKVTFWFWLMYPPPPPPQERKSWISGQGDILVMADVLPPPEMKSWKSGKKFLWQISHDQSSTYPPQMKS